MMNGGLAHKTKVLRLRLKDKHAKFLVGARSRGQFRLGTTATNCRSRCSIANDDFSSGYDFAKCHARRF